MRGTLFDTSILAASQHVAKSGTGTSAKSSPNRTSDRCPTSGATGDREQTKQATVTTASAETLTPATLAELLNLLDVLDLLNGLHLLNLLHLHDSLHIDRLLHDLLHNDSLNLDRLRHRVALASPRGNCGHQGHRYRKKSLHD